MVVFNLALIYIDLGPRPVSRRFGISTLTSLRLFSRAPCTRMRSCESAASRCACDASRSGQGLAVCAARDREPRTGRFRRGQRHALGNVTATVAAAPAFVAAAWGPAAPSDFQ